MKIKSKEESAKGLGWENLEISFGHVEHEMICVILRCLSLVDSCLRG